MQIPGTERQKIKDIDELAVEYVEWRDKRQAAGREEVVLKTKLIEEMKTNKLTEYVTQDDEVVELKPGKEKLRVHPIDDDEDED